MTAQDIANRIGAGIRATEQALAAGDIEGAKAAIADTHQAATDGFAYLDKHTKLHLDWDQVAGNSTASAPGGVHILEGGNKDKPV